ncbi:MAG: hypothetical protein R3324_06230 [Halobacteriales archaeon]|nr:hypothetical protein [Halobacteriales archaeon]
MSDATIKGRSVKGVTRPSKEFGDGRTCLEDACITKLSRYNKRDYCYLHSPVKYPRVRGRVVPEGT